MYTHTCICYIIIIHASGTGSYSQSLNGSIWKHAPDMGWHYLSKATCLTRPHLFYASFVVSRVVVICNMICTF